MKPWGWIVILIALLGFSYLVELDRVTAGGMFLAFVMVLLVQAVRDDVQRIEERLDRMIEYIGATDGEAVPLREILETIRDVRLEIRQE